MHSFRPVEQPRVSAAIFNQLKQTLLPRYFKQGYKRPSERMLPEEFQVGREVVREAMHTLENSGLAVTLLGSNRGSYATDH